MDSCVLRSVSGFGDELIRTILKIKKGGGYRITVSRFHGIWGEGGYLKSGEQGSGVRNSPRFRSRFILPLYALGGNNMQTIRGAAASAMRRPNMSYHPAAFGYAGVEPPAYPSTRAQGFDQRDEAALAEGIGLFAITDLASLPEFESGKPNSRVGEWAVRRGAQR